MRPSLASRFESLFDRRSVLSEQSSVEPYAIDGEIPQLVLLPASVEQVSAALRVANEENWPVVPFGGGTRQQVGRSLQGVDLVLSTERLNQIEAYDPGDLTIALEGGANLQRVVQKCAEHRQLLPLEGAERATIGGTLASAESGPLRTGFGAARDFCIGVSFITGDGVSARAGGRVVKNVAGYDLMKLMIGSYGTLGIIVSANFKLFPMPQRTMTCVCEFESLAEALKVRDWLLRSPLSPIAAELLNPPALEYLGDREARDPDEWAPETQRSVEKTSWQLAIRFTGSERVLARCRRELRSSISKELHDVEESDFWKRLASFEQSVIQRHRNAMIFEVNVPIAEAESALEAARIAATDYNFLAAIIGRATIGSFVMAFLTLALDPPAVTQFASAASDFRSRLSKSSSAVVVHCPREAKQHFDVWGSVPTDLELMQKVKHTLDPKGILNRGRFLVR
jgi:glycolate oxidase FAD binding subunit